MDRIKKKELIDILEENYYTLETTGAQALVNILEDINRDAFSENLEEWGIGRDRMLQIVNEMIDQWCLEGKMETPAIDWYQNGARPAAKMRTRITPRARPEIRNAKRKSREIESTVVDEGEKNSGI